MPQTYKNYIIKYYRGSRTARAQVPRDPEYAAVSVQDAFIAALENFREEYERDPNWEYVRFLGGFTTFETLFQIVEDEDAVNI